MRHHVDLGLGEFVPPSPVAIPPHLAHSEGRFAASPFPEGGESRDFVDYSKDDDGRITPDSKRCVGAAIFLEQIAGGGMLANVQFRLAAMFGELRPNELSNSIPVYNSIEAFVDGASSHNNG